MSVAYKDIDFQKFLFREMFWGLGLGFQQGLSRSADGFGILSAERA